MPFTETQVETSVFANLASQTVFVSSGALNDGALLVLTCEFGGSRAISSIVQAGAVWTKAVDYLNGVTRTEIWYAEGITAAGSTITINHSATSTFNTGFNITEYAGARTVGALDVVHPGTDSGVADAMIGLFNPAVVGSTAGQLWVWASGNSNSGADLIRPAMFGDPVIQNEPGGTLHTLTNLAIGIRSMLISRAQVGSWSGGGQVAALFHAANPIPIPDARIKVINGVGSFSGPVSFIVGALGALEDSLLVLTITLPGSGSGYVEVTSISQTDVTWVRAAQHQVGPTDINGTNHEIWFGTVTGPGAAAAAATVNIVNGADYYAWGYLELDGLVGNDVSIIEAIDTNTGTGTALATGLGTLTAGPNRLILVSVGTNHGLTRATGVYDPTNGFNLIRKVEAGAGGNRPSNTLMSFTADGVGQFQTQLTTDTSTLWSTIMLTLDIVASPPDQATTPAPVDTATGVDQNTLLGWAVAPGATSYDVYFGTDQTDVTNGTGGTSQGNQVGTSFDPTPTGDLDALITYYWRIDTVNASGTTAGLVWSFTTLADPLLPAVSNQEPVPGGVEVSRVATVDFTITGDEDVDLNSLNVEIQEDGGGYNPAIVSGVPVFGAGVASAVTAVVNGYDVVFEHIVAFADTVTIDVRINADNMNSIPAPQVDYSFTTGSVLPSRPVIIAVAKGSN